MAKKPQHSNVEKCIYFLIVNVTTDVMSVCVCGWGGRGKEEQKEGEDMEKRKQNLEKFTVTLYVLI